MPPEQDAGGKTASWEAIREANIPPCVKEINFTINDEDLVPELREKLESSYSGVTIVSPGIVAEKERACKALTAERPDGIKQMIIELDADSSEWQQETVAERLAVVQLAVLPLDSLLIIRRTGPT